MKCDNQDRNISRSQKLMARKQVSLWTFDKWFLSLGKFEFFSLQSTPSLPYGSSDVSLWLQQPQCTFRISLGHLIFHKQCFPGVELDLFGLMFSSCDELWSGHLKTATENPASQSVDGQEASRKASKERLWVLLGSKEETKLIAFLQSRDDDSCMTRTVWSTPAIVVLGRRKKTSSRRDGGYRTSDCYLSTAQKVISPMTLRVFHTDIYLQSTPKCLCRRELLSNFSFVAVKARGLVQVSKLFSMHRPPLHCVL